MKTLSVLVLACLVAVSSRAETIEFFDASKAGADAWSWSGARVKAVSGGLAVKEANPAESYGDAFPSDRFPYVPGGEIEIELAGPPSGNFTLQVLGFVGESHVALAEPIKDSVDPSRHVVKVAALGLPAEVETILIKLWVGGEEGASAIVKNLRYLLRLNADQILRTETWTDPAGWTTDEMSLTPADGGLTWKLTGPESFGSALLQPMLPRRDEAVLLLDISEVSGGRVKVQFASFDANGTYLSSVDAASDLGTGWCAIREGNIDWPEGASQFQLKLWYAGSADGYAILNGLRVIRP